MNFTSNFFHVFILVREEPDCVLGHIIKILTKEEDFLHKVIIIISISIWNIYFILYQLI